MQRLVGLALLVSGPTMAQTCPSPPGWDKPVKHLAAASPDMKFALATGTTTELALRQCRGMKLAARSEHTARPCSPSGLAALDVAKAGKLDVILSTATYVDLVRDGQILKSSGHSDLKACNGFRKSVTFDVVPGRYIVQLTDAPAQTVKMATVVR